MDYSDAYKKVEQYLTEKTGRSSIDTITENDNKWFFGSGKDLIGNIIVSVNKKTGEIALVDFLSDEGYDEISKSKAIK